MQQVKRAVRALILRNELEGDLYLATWLESIADDFQQHGLEVEDLRAYVAKLRAEHKARHQR